MKKIVFVIILLGVAAGVVRLVWFKGAEPDAAEAPVATEVPVHVGKITRATLRGYVTAYGLVEAEPQGERPAASARVASSVSGVVTEVNCVEGQRVEKGAPLVQLDSRAADVAAAFAEKTLERQEEAGAGGRRVAKVIAGCRAASQCGARPAGPALGGDRADAS